ncbi:MAG: neutral/alkaline non-lysosomal ceramidase N-terminal domain-containing protein [Verrucomicrobiota bacterium]|nr:neutral/alkaline non-lysosomal ceramidase N-terminal domain-containing protein [Verrucomicrobiota bacterium]
MRSFAIFLLLISVAAGAAEVGWKAGAAKVVITPGQPMLMAGYAARTKPAEGTAQELFAKALALEDGHGKRLVIVTLDLVGVPRALHTWLQTRLGETHGLPPESLLLNASHTHCGPKVWTRYPPELPAELETEKTQGEYRQTLENKLLELIGDALSELAPAQMSYHRARCGFAMNRRLPVDGSYRNAPNPEGPVDHEVPVLRVARADGRLRAILFGYACHNTTLSFYQWCGDYAGYAQEYLEADHPGTVALFVQGCGGDQNPYPRGRIEHAQFHGRALATAAQAALGTPPRPVTGPLRAALEDVELDFAPAPSRTEWEQRAQSREKHTAEYGRRMLARLDREGKLPERYPYPVQVIRFGDSLTLVALAGEVVVDYALRLRRELPGAPLWVAGYCNDVMAYIPSRRVLQQGGYEAGDAMRFFMQPAPWAPTVEERIIGKVHELLRAGANPERK